MQLTVIIIAMGSNICRSYWPWARIIETFPGKDGILRSCTVFFDLRSSIKLCLLEGSDWLFVPIVAIFTGRGVCLYILLYRISSNKCLASNKSRPLISAAPYPHWNKSLPLIIPSPQITVGPLNIALISTVTIFYQELNQNAYGPSMKTRNHWKY